MPKKTNTKHRDVLILDASTLRQNAFRRRFPCCKCFASVFSLCKHLSANRASVLFLEHDLDGHYYANPNSPDNGMELVRWLEEQKGLADRGWLCDTTSGCPPEIETVVLHSENHAANVSMKRKLEAIGRESFCMPFSGMFVSRHGSEEECERRREGFFKMIRIQ